MDMLIFKKCQYFASMPIGPLIISIACYGTSISRGSRLKVLNKIGVLENFGKFIGKHLCWSLFFKKWRLAASNFIKRETLADVNITKFLLTSFLQKNLRETASVVLFKLFSINLLIFLACCSTIVKKYYFMC